MRPGGRIRRACLALAAALLLGCSFSTDFVIRRHQLLIPLQQGLVNSYNIEEHLAAGYIPEVLAFLKASSGGIESTRLARVAGQAILERGDFRAARLPLERAFLEEGRLSVRADLAWKLSQSFYWTGEFTTSARWARQATAFGLRIPDGWIAFLDSGEKRLPYSGARPGDRLRIPMTLESPRIPRVVLEINGHPAGDIVFDTGASMSLITEKAAAAAGIKKVPGGETSAHGLHRVEFPLHLGWADKIQIGSLTLKDVPFGIVPDDALAFQTSSGGDYRFDGVLGAHFLKEFDWRLEYARRQILAVRLDPDLPRGSRDQNIFFRRLKPMVRSSFNQRPWLLLLLDTGSEPSMVSRQGLRKMKEQGVEALYPVTIEGIGKSRVSWGKISKVTLGVDRYMISFADIIVREDSEGIEDGVLGSSFLANFETEIRFGAMKVSFELPTERALREAEEARPVP